MQLEKDDYIENLHILSCSVLLKSGLLISCVFWIFFQNAGSQLCFRIFFFFFQEYRLLLSTSQFHLKLYDCIVFLLLLQSPIAQDNKQTKVILLSYCSTVEQSACHCQHYFGSCSWHSKFGLTQHQNQLKSVHGILKLKEITICVLLLHLHHYPYTSQSSAESLIKYNMGRTFLAMAQYQDRSFFQKAIKIALRCILNVILHLLGFKLYNPALPMM